MTEANVTAVHIKALVDSGCTLDLGVISGMFQAERAVALRALVTGIEALADRWELSSCQFEAPGADWATDLRELLADALTRSEQSSQ